MSITERTRLVLKTKLGDKQSADELVSAIEIGGGGGIEDAINDGVTDKAPSENAVYDALQAKQDLISLGTNKIMRTDGSADIAEAGVWYFDENSGGISVNADNIPDGTTSYLSFINNFSTLRPSAASADWAIGLHNRSVFIDPDSSGHAIGTNGSCATIDNLYFQHQGTSNIGSLTYVNMSADIGNGTDPINVKSITGAQLYSNFNSGVTLDGPVQGFVFQPSFDSGSTLGSNHYQNAFCDFSNLSNVTSGPYSSVQISPQIGNVKNNANANGININPTITALTGNAGFTGVGVFGTFGTFGASGYFQGVAINPTVTSVPNATGLYVDMSNTTVSGTKYAAQFIGDVSITGSLSFTGSLSVGQLNAYYSSAPVNGGGNPQTMHGLVTQMVGAASTTVANCDVIGVNTAMLIQLNANSVNTSGPFKLGMTALALPCVVETHTGSSVDYMSGATYAINLSNTSTGGTITNLNLCRSVVIPNGITTITNVRAFYVDAPFGLVGTNNWAFYDETDSENFLKQSLKIGGTPGSTDKVTNSSVALEIESTTRAAVLSRMTTTERNALSAINGMMIYNTTTNKFQGYAGGAWVDLH